MSNNKVTQELFAEALYDLLKERSLEKISVKDITEQSKLSRNTFYYHFKDKYELVNWIFYSDMRAGIREFEDACSVTESFQKVCSRLYHEREFYRPCFKYIGQNSLFEYMHEIYYELWKKKLVISCRNAGVRLPEEKIVLKAKLNAYTMIGVLSDWMKNGMHENYISYLDQVAVLLESGNTVFFEKLIEEQRNAWKFVSKKSLVSA